jgi:hypothetical protein
MSYLVGVKLPSGEFVHRRAENVSDLPYVTDDGETLRVVHDQDDFPFTADMCNSARAWRSHWRHAAAGVPYPGSCSALPSTRPKSSR